MKIIYTIFISICLLSCTTSQNYVFYKSNAGLPQKSKAINTEFFLPQYSDNLPFAVLAAIDRDMFDNVKNYYILISSGVNANSTAYNAADYANSLAITVSPNNAKKLMSVIDSALSYYKVRSQETTGNTIYYTIKSENKDLDIKSPDFEFYFRSFIKGNEVYVKLNVPTIDEKNFSQTYILKKSDLNEFHYRISESLRILEKFGYKE